MEAAPDSGQERTGQEHAGGGEHAGEPCVMLAGLNNNNNNIYLYVVRYP